MYAKIGCYNVLLYNKIIPFCLHIHLMKVAYINEINATVHSFEQTFQSLEKNL